MQGCPLNKSTPCFNANKESKLQAVANTKNVIQAVATITKDTIQAVAYMGSATKATLLTRIAMRYFQAAYEGLSC